MTKICKGVTVPSGVSHVTSDHPSFLRKMCSFLGCLSNTKVPFVKELFCSRKAFFAFLTVGPAGYAR